MGLIDEISGSKICIDTAPFVYFIENNPKYFAMLEPLFSEIDAEKTNAVTSTITLLEVMVLPLKNNDKALADKYRDILLNSAGLTTHEVSHDMAGMAARLRAKYSIRTPDAIQIATGIILEADAFLTNDINFKKVNDIKVFILDDFL